MGEQREPWRPKGAPAFSMDFSKEVANQVALINQWVNDEMERGATEALADALRSKGWTVTPPPEPSAREPERPHYHWWTEEHPCPLGETCRSLAPRIDTPPPDKV